MSLYLEKRDPVKKAQRQKNRGKFIDSAKENLSKPIKKKQAESTIHKDKDKDKDKSKNSFRNKYCSVDKNSSREELPVVINKRKRKAIPAKLTHQVQLRDQARCTHKTLDGARCFSRRYLEIHHIQPVSLGGENTLNNLTLLCSGHHKVAHFQ